MLRSAVVGIFLLSLLIQPLSRTIIYASFKFDQKYIIKNLCENRDKPLSTCQGTCQLKKRLQKQEEQENKLPENLSLREIAFYLTLIDEFIFLDALSNTNHSGFRLINISQSYFSKIFHPPKLV